ncbi:MAG: cupin domain-containing protein [Oligoflexales bacterium]|nr:cupin domain-containing protein [Oligoflexales bacterium]
MLELGMEVNVFLREFWQKKPLFIKGGLKNFSSPFSENELAGLACEEGFESRLVIEQGKVPWELKSGPFDEDTLTSLPKNNWSLLVQDVDKWVSELSELKSFFRFVPDWRFDDIMVSYSPQGGSVGAHLDHYDVFLFQVTGKKRWSIESKARQKGDDAFLSGIELRQLERFEPDHEFILEAGDLLYLPPRCAHHGVTLDPGMTFSMGFHAPSYRELLKAHLEYCISQIDEDERLSDPDLQQAHHPAEISSATLQKVSLLLKQLSSAYEGLPHWLGVLLSSPKGQHSGGYGAVPPSQPYTWEACERELRSCPYLTRDESCRMHFIEQEHGLLVFVNGIEMMCPTNFLNFVRLISGSYVIEGNQVLDEIRKEPSCREFFLELLNQGYFYWNQE